MTRWTTRRTLLAALACAALAQVFDPAVRAAAPAGQYTVSGGTVIDNKTKLIWQQQVSPTMHWDQAKAYCSSASLSAELGAMPIG
jgi:hypothetical protein